MVDVHTIATFAFARLERDPAFRRDFPWVRNTIICVESDLASAVLDCQMRHYFPDGGTAAVYYPSDKQFTFIAVGAPQGEEVTFADNSRGDEITMGALVDAIHSRDRGDAAVGQASTAVIEEKLALT